MATVLVVDDAAVDRKLVAGLLGKAWDLTVEQAADGHEALAMIEALRPAIVVTDLVMPGMSGRDLAEELTKREMRAKVLLTSAYTDRLTAETTPNTIRGFLHKPYGESDLAQAVRRAMDGA